MKAKEFIPPSKPRNFVAKNQKTAGAGAHKDKKRAEKHGDVKHKKNLATTENSKYPFAGAKVGHKEGPAGQLKGKMKRPARAGDLVGGG